MNVKRALMAAVGLLITSQALANSDTGRIAELYSHPTGSMAVRLEGGLDNSEKDTKCGNTTLEWGRCCSRGGCFNQVKPAGCLRPGQKSHPGNVRHLHRRLDQNRSDAYPQGLICHFDTEPDYRLLCQM